MHENENRWKRNPHYHQRRSDGPVTSCQNNKPLGIRFLQGGSSNTVIRVSSESPVDDTMTCREFPPRIEIYHRQDLKRYFPLSRPSPVFQRPLKRKQIDFFNKLMKTLFLVFISEFFQGFVVLRCSTEFFITSFFDECVFNFP